MLAQDSRVVYSEDFETTDDVANWGVFVGATGNTTKTQNATGGVDGGGALELGDAGFGFLMERAITATIGSEYQLTFDVKTSNWASDRLLYVSLIGIDAHPKLVNVSNLTDFTTITLSGKATNSSGHIRIEGSNGGGTNNVWIDNITLSVNQAFTVDNFYNESFETVDDITNWGVFVGATGNTTKTQNPTGGVNGTGALELGDAGFGFLMERAITATSGSEYKLTFDVKTANWASDRLLYVSLIGIDAQPKLVNISNLTEFTTISLGGKATSASGHLRIQGTNGGGTNNVWIDNISLTNIDMDVVGGMETPGIVGQFLLQLIMLLWMAH